MGFGKKHLHAAPFRPAAERGDAQPSPGRQRIGLPRGYAVSTHILEPAIAAVKGSVINEAFCMGLGQAMGLQVADAKILTAGDQQLLLVSRYDRRRDQQDQWLRLHQEDFCQALGVPPELKYQNEGGPDLNACFGLLRRVTRPSAPQVIRLLEAVVFNTLVGNHDVHAKNFSLLYAGRAATLAPLYDLLCTAVYPRLTKNMAMKQGSKTRFSEVQMRHWERFAQVAGLSWAQTRKGWWAWRSSFQRPPAACIQTSATVGATHEGWLPTLRVASHRRIAQRGTMVSGTTTDPTRSDGAQSMGMPVYDHTRIIVHIKRTHTLLQVRLEAGWKCGLPREAIWMSFYWDMPFLGLGYS